MEDNNKKDPSLMVDEWLKEIMAKLDLPDQSETKAGDLGGNCERKTRGSIDTMERIYLWQGQKR